MSLRSWWRARRRRPFDYERDAPEFCQRERTYVRHVHTYSPTQPTGR